MNFKRICMGLISLVLVACLLVNVSPIKAEAFAGSIAYVTASVVICGIIGALGVQMGNALSNVVADTVGDCHNAMAAATDWLTDEDNIAVYSLGMNQYYAHQDMVEWVRQWLFENEVLTETSVTVPSGYWLYNGLQYKPLPSYDTSLYRYAAIVTNSGSNQTGLYVSTLPLGFSGQDSGKTNLVNINSSQVDCLYFVYSSGNWSTEGASFSYDAHTAIVSYSWRISWKWANYDITNADGSILQLAGSEPVIESYTEFSAAEGLETAYVAPFSQALSVGYADWAAGVIDLPKEGSDEPVVYWPLGLAPTVEDTALIPQTNAWQGLSTIDDNVDPPETQPPDDDFGDETLLTELTSLAFFDLIRRFHSQYWFNSLQDLINNGTETLSFLSSWGETLSIHLNEIAQHIHNVGKTITDSFSQIFTELRTDLALKLSEMTSTLTQTFTQTLSQMQTKLVEKLGELTQSLTQVMESIQTKTLEATKEAFLPEENYIQTKVDDLTTQYAFADSIAKTGIDLKEFFLTLGSVPPVIYIHLSNSTGSYNWGNDMVLIDFSFYEPYKPTMDAILSAFLWLWFCWRVVLSLPGILSGVSGMSGAKIDVSSIGSSGYTMISSVPTADSSESGRIYQTKEQRQSGTQAYNEWRKKHK